ncbi:MULTISPECIES: helix-turn-helix domain-containing protein [Arthrobacter]|uniref:helix-turn-helix domain-containing protein n=1 Tax=Arthrobacter TaxID=1663 RepID=UPI001404A0C6|nr:MULTISPECIES: helix-turn-helix transcriptional regulator [Arthrobacter]MBT8159328.1 helix-turn-helix domain-containing protein [Arthrobacter sp. GN70]
MTLLDARIGHIIKRERRRKKLTLVDLSLLVGANHSTLSNYESGKRRVPPERVTTLAQALDIDPRLIDPRADQDGDPPKVRPEHTPKSNTAPVDVSALVCAPCRKGPKTRGN